jgi:ATP-dependent Clp protease ATP-binding subunit ClpX
MPRSAKGRYVRRELEVVFRRPEEYDDALSAVVSQDELKVKLKSAFSQYTAFLGNPAAGRPVIMVYGQTGSGKTFAIERMAKASQLPLTILSCAALSPPSYKGVTVQDILVRHWMKHRTDQGVIFLDELNKWCQMALTRENKSISNAEDIGNGIRSQHEMLRYVEGEIVNFVDVARDFEQLADVEFDTGRILWVFGGSFLGLPGLIRRRLGGTYHTDDELWEHALPGDFQKYGMVEELSLRIQTYAWTKPLDAIELLQILEQQEWPRWQMRFERLGCQLEMKPGVLGLIAHHAFQEKVGARGAVSLMRRAMDDIYYHVSQQKRTHFIVDTDMIETGQVPPEFEEPQFKVALA